MESNFDFGRYTLEHTNGIDYICDQFIGLKVRVIHFSALDAWSESRYELRFYAIDSEDTLIFETVDFYGQYDEAEIKESIRWFLTSIGKPDQPIVDEVDDTPFKILEFYNVDTAEQLASLGIPKNLSVAEETLRVKLFKQRLALQKKLPYSKLEFIEVPPELDRG